MASLKGPLLKRLKTDLQDVIKRGYLTEKCVGITEFLGKHQPFIGIMKQRFEDFIVHEIDKDGNTVILENIDKPQDVFETSKQDVDDNLISIDNLKIDPSFKEAIDQYVQNNMQTKEPYPMLPIDGLDKQERGMVHLFIKQNYKDLESRTENIGDKKFIKIVPLKQLNNRQKRTMKWTKPDYVHFVLYKENMETAQVVNELSRRLGATTKNFSIAGSKDKRAITTQQFCAYKTNPVKIWQACKDFNFRSHNHVRLHVGHFRFNPEPLRLGDLRGNKFEIILRNIRLVDTDTDRSQPTTNQIDFQVIEQALKFAQNNGFINYYGMQRFGSHRIDSHKLGILILRKEFKRLCEEILVEKPIDLRPYQKNNGGRKNNNNNHHHHNEISFNEAIRLWRDTRDAAMAYKKMNYKYTIEGSLLRAMTKVDPNDYHGALCIGLARNSRLLYLHAYQSYLWNRIASYRLREFGSNVIVGDLVMIGRPNDPPIDPLIDQDDLPMEDLEPVEDGQVDGDGGNHQSHDHHQPANPNIKSNISDDQIVVVTDGNIEQFTIFDVVLPIIGGLSKLPENKMKDFIQKLMAEDQVSIEQFQSLGKQWCVNGSYRKLLEKPSDLEWQFIEYTDDLKPLVKTDLDRINERRQKDGGGGQQTDPIDQHHDQQPNNLVEPGKIALKIQVTLPSSSYATMFLREITKISSSSLENKPWQRSSTTTTTTATLDDDDKRTKIADDHQQHREEQQENVERESIIL